MEKINPIGEKVKRMREKKCWPQAQLAEISGLSERTIQRVENNEMASMESIKAIASAFDISVEELLEQKTSINEKRLDFLIRVNTGKELFSLIEGSEAYQFSNDDPKNKQEVEIIGDFLQNVRDCGDIWNDIEPKDRINFSFDANEWIEDLEKMGFWVFAGRAVRTCVTRLGEVNLNVLTVGIYRKNNPKIVRVKPLKETLSIIQDSHFSL